MTLKKRHLLLYLVILLTIIVSYNYWSFRCGYCSLSSLLSFSPPALVLIAGNLAALLALAVIRVRQRRRLQRQHCTCGELLRSSWSFCPDCGVERQS